MTKWVVGNTGLRVQRNSDGSGELIPAGIIPQVAESFTISKVAGVSTLTITFYPTLAGSIGSFIWNGVEHCQFNAVPTHGGAFQGSELFMPTYPSFGLSQGPIPTEQGSQADGANLHRCTSNSLFIGKSAAGDRAYMITDAAEWIDPDSITLPVSYTDRFLSGFVRSRDITIGDGGTQVVHVLQTLTIPTRADIQGAAQPIRWRIISPMSCFTPSSTFSRMFQVDVQNGTTTREVFPVLNGAQLLHATDPYICVSADGSSSALGVYAPISEWDPTYGRFCGASITSNMESTYFDIADYGPSGISGTRVNNSWICFGTLSDVAASMRALYLSNP